MARGNQGVVLGANEARALVGRYREAQGMRPLMGRSQAQTYRPLMGNVFNVQRGHEGGHPGGFGGQHFGGQPGGFHPGGFGGGGFGGGQFGGGGRAGAIRREEHEERHEEFGGAPGFGGRGRGHEERREEHHEIKREEWEAAHPGEQWEEREHRRHEWEQTHPGVAFVGADALIGALASSGIAPRAFLRDLPGPTMANRQVLPMNTGSTPVPANTTAQITSRPQRVAFRPERIFVSAGGTDGGAADWIINDVTIGNRSQFAQSGALPGDMFGSQAIDSFVTFETAQTAMDVVMLVTYQGGTQGGVPFFGSIIGTAAV